MIKWHTDISERMIFQQWQKDKCKRGIWNDDINRMSLVTDKRMTCQEQQDILKTEFHIENDNIYQMQVDSDQWLWYENDNWHVHNRDILQPLVVTKE